MTCRAIFLVLLVTLLSIVSIHADLELVSDEDLEKLIANEKNVIALFRTESCSKCDELEGQLSSIREDLVDSLNAWVVKLSSSPLASNFTSGKDSGKPFIVYFRQHIPMLYDGPLNDEVILETLVQNQQPLVSSLSDETFEHLTQAASGATTGDWFVLFYRSDCKVCMRFRSKWEYIASQLKGRINLAEVNVMGDGISTGSRFGIEKVPTFLFFRQSKTYLYDLPNMDSKAFQDFALGWYKNVPSKNVPSPKTPFDELVDRAVFTLKENPWILPVAGVSLLVIIVLIALSAWKSRKAEKSKPAKKSKTSKTTKKAD